MLWSNPPEDHDMEWSEELIARLRGLWDEGLSTAEIGRRLGMSKNAIIGKAHRLSLPGRPSPIRAERPPGVPRRRTPRRLTGPTLPPLAASAFPAATRRAEPGPIPPRRVGSEPPLAAPRETPKPRVAVYAPGFPRLGGRQLTCCWPIGEPGTPSFHFCEAPAVPGKPYCDEHAQIAYVRVRDRREDAA
jgi:GcrA cell cycle regulator